MKNRECDEILGKDDLLQLLQASVTCETEIRNTLRDTMSTYITLLCSIVAGILAISSISTVRLIMPLSFAFGGIIVSWISIVGYQHYKSDYTRQIEEIVEQAKLQDLLGLTDPNMYRLRTYWTKESLLPQSFVETRRACKTSKDFVTWFMKNTDTRWVRSLYICFGVIGAVFAVLGCLLLFGVQL